VTINRAAPAPLWTADEVANHLKVSKRYVWRLARTGQLTHTRLGRSLRFDPRQVQLDMAARSKKAS
jgi:excisionase family DNA binding protein